MSNDEINKEIGASQSCRRYLILTPFAQAEVVAAILKIRKISAAVFPSASGVLVGKDLPAVQFKDWDISELLGDMPAEQSTSVVGQENENAPDSAVSREEDPEYIGALLSKLSPYGVILLRAELGKDIGGEVGVAGVISAQRIIAGKKGEEIAPGLLLGALDPKIEDLLIGTTPLAENAERIMPHEATNLLENIAQNLTANTDSSSEDSVNSAFEDSAKPESPAEDN